jgi:hypothetical protein
VEGALLTSALSVIGDRYRRVIGIVALVAWVASLALPVETECLGLWYSSPGYRLALIGWLGALVGQFGWYANPFMLWQIGRLLLGRRPGIIGSLIALCLTLSAFFWKTSFTGDAWITICERHAGFYIWIACAVLLAAVALIELMRRLPYQSPGETA